MTKKSQPAEHDFYTALDKKARPLFDNKIKGIGALEYPFKKGLRCHCCSYTAVKRVIVCIDDGIVCDYDMCAAHAAEYANKVVKEVVLFEEEKTA